jgi:hypothetical protein
MFQNAHVMRLLIIFIKKIDSQPKHVTIGLFEPTKVIGLILTRNLT